MKAAKPSELPLIWTFFLRYATKAAKPSASPKGDPHKIVLKKQRIAAHF